MDKINNRNNWIFGNCKNVLEDKNELLRITILSMLNKTIKMFKYNNLPETITSKDIEIYNQVNGFTIWGKDPKTDKLYVFYGGLGGEPSPYYLPTKSIVTNPSLKLTEEWEIDKNCVVMPNDYFYQGLMPLNNKYGSLLTEAELSLKYAILNARIPALIQADDDVTAASAKAFINKVYSGADYGIISSQALLEGIKTYDFYKQAYIKDLIESIQYIKGTWYNELGLNAQFNMKREAINESEANMNDNILFPTVDGMLERREHALDKINNMFNTNITVELDSSWLHNTIKQDLEIDLISSEIEKGSEISDETENENNWYSYRYSKNVYT